MTQTIHTHIQFLKKCLDDEFIDRKVFDLSVDMMNDILNATNWKTPIPDSCTGPNGEMFYSWDMGKRHDKGEHHFEIEIVPDSDEPLEFFQFFYRNRVSGEFWGEDHSLASWKTERILDTLKLFYCESKPQ